MASWAYFRGRSWLPEGCSVSHDDLLSNIYTFVWASAELTAVEYLRRIHTWMADPNRLDWSHASQFSQRLKPRLCRHRAHKWDDAVTLSRQVRHVEDSRSHDAVV
jgi:hypothetical protein